MYYTEKRDNTLNGSGDIWKIIRFAINKSDNSKVFLALETIIIPK